MPKETTVKKAKAAKKPAAEPKKAPSLEDLVNELLGLTLGLGLSSEPKKEPKPEAAKPASPSIDETFLDQLIAKGVVKKSSSPCSIDPEFGIPVPNCHDDCSIPIPDCCHDDCSIPIPDCHINRSITGSEPAVLRTPPREYVRRLVEDYKDIAHKVGKLHRYLARLDAGVIEESISRTDLLREQEAHLTLSLRDLEVRLLVEGVDPFDFEEAPYRE